MYTYAYTCPILLMHFASLSNLQQKLTPQMKKLQDRASFQFKAWQMLRSNIAFPIMAGDQMGAANFVGDNTIANGFYFLDLIV